MPLNRRFLTLRQIKPDWFLIGMGVAVFLAWCFPEPGADGGSLHPELLTKLGVALIFFFNGVSLSFAAIKQGTLRWPLHLVVQGSTFVFFPILGWLLFRLTGPWMPQYLDLGFFYLCALPSTVSSSVAMTSAARGNVPAAVFNATLSSLIGVLATPLWVSLVMAQTGQSHSLGKVVLDLVLWLLLPLTVGQLSRPLLGAWAARNKPLLYWIDRGTILLLVYTSFCDSMKWGVWSGHSLSTLGITLVGTTILFFLVLAAVTGACNALHFSREDRIAAVFCGSKKTLASGVPMARLIFGAHPGLSLILLPIMLYHPLQLIICSALASRWAREVPQQTPPEVNSASGKS